MINDTTNKQYFSMPRREMLPYLPPNAKHALDVGCGTGAFGRELLKLNRNLTIDGVELFEKAAKQAEQHLNIVWSGSILDVISKIPDQTYDCIFFNDVLEHIEDPWFVLRQIRSKLTGHGVIVCSIPNMRFHSALAGLLFKKDWKYVDEGVLDRTHLRFFTKKSLLRMFGDCDYEVLKIAGIKKTKSLRPYFYLLLTLGWFGLDSFYLQFACVIQPKQLPDSNPKCNIISEKMLHGKIVHTPESGRA